MEAPMIALLLAGHAVSVLAQDCIPDCRTGFFCHEGQCISKCNPQCGDAQTCTDEGECEDVEATDSPDAEQVRMGRVCVFRRRSVAGATTPFNLREDNESITSLMPGTFYCWDTSTGRHTYSARTDIVKTWDIEVPEETTICFEARPVMGTLLWRFDLVESTVEAMEAPKRPFRNANQVSNGF